MKGTRGLGGVGADGASLWPLLEMQPGLSSPASQGL